MDLLIWNYFGKNMVIIGDPVGDKASVSFRSTKSMSCFLHVGYEKMFVCDFTLKVIFTMISLQSMLLKWILYTH